MQFTRKLDLLACLIACLSLGTVYYLELQFGLKPCPLCIVQRLILLLVLLLFLFGGLMPLGNFGRRFYHFFVLLVSSAGTAVAARHVYLTTLPASQVPPCEASLNVLLKYLPWQEVTSMIYRGGGDCNLISWRFISLSLPTWSLIAFTLLTCIALWQLFYKNPVWVK